VLKRRRLEGLPLLRRHVTNWGVPPGTLANRSRMRTVRCMGRGATSTRSDDSGSV
jgi:hypothetical protein